MANYLPIPPRVWSRVQNQCTFQPNEQIGNPGTVFIPSLNKTVSNFYAIEYDKMIKKGNVLQYKKNSCNLTNNQKYSKLAKRQGPSRTTCFATQTETYSNPNTHHLLESNSEIYEYNNIIVGAPNNPGGPFAYNVSNPFGCKIKIIKVVKNLVCGIHTNVCTGEIIDRPSPESQIICNEASCSDVPGRGILCWDQKIKPWYPKQRYVMNNSTDKWPINYKGFTSALYPNAPILSSELNCDNVTLNWGLTSKSQCLPISNYKIYVNDELYETVSSDITSVTLQVEYNKLYFFNVTSFVTVTSSPPVESKKSNTVYISTYLNSPHLNANVIPTDNTQINLSWSTLIPSETQNGWKLYQNGILYASYPLTTLTTTISGLITGNNYSYWITSASCNSESSISNVVTVTPNITTIEETTPGTYNYSLSSNVLYYTCVVIGGGGGGGGGYNMGTAGLQGGLGGSGGGGGGISMQTSNVLKTTQTNINYTVGIGGYGGISSSGSNGTQSTLNDGLSLVMVSTGGSGGTYYGALVNNGDSTTINNGGTGGIGTGGTINGNGGTGGNSGGIGSPTDENVGFSPISQSGQVSSINQGPGGGGGGGCIYRTSGGSGGVYFDSVAASGGNGGNWSLGGLPGQYSNGENGNGTIGYGGSGGGGVGGNRYSDSVSTGNGGNGIYGSGGGGGGAYHTNGNSGAGGNGGNGVVYIVLYLMTIT